jgi:hypothetical protein
VSGNPGLAADHRDGPEPSAVVMLLAGNIDYLEV